MKILLTIAVAFLSLTAIGQPDKKSVVIGSMTTRPNALLIVNPEHADQGVLFPQLSSDQRNSMRPSSPYEDGLIVYDKSVNAYYYWVNGKWIRIKAEEDGKTKYCSIDPVSFRELKPDNNIRHTNMVVFESDNSFVTASGDGLGERIMAPVNLPHGAVIKEVRVYYMDNDDDNIKIQLLRKSLSGGAEQIVAWESSGASTFVNNVSLTSFNGKGNIDLANFTYRLIATFDIGTFEEIDSPAEARQRIYGVRIKYEE